MQVDAVSDTSYNLVPSTAGLTGGIRVDRGGIAGTIKDCAGGLVKQASVGVTGETKLISFFDADVSDLMPDTSRFTSNGDSTWVSLSHEEGVWEAVAAALINGSIVTSRKVTYRIYRNSIIIVAFRFDNAVNYPQEAAE